MYQNSSLYPKFLDYHSIYTLLCEGDGYELLLNRFTEDKRKPGLFGNYGNCCIIPETKERLLSNRKIRNIPEAMDVVCSAFEPYSYLEDRTLREKIENKREEIQLYKKYNILVSNSHTIEESENLFSIGFVFDVNLEKSEREELDKSIKGIDGVHSVDFTE